MATSCRIQIKLPVSELFFLELTPSPPPKLPVQVVALRQQAASYRRRAWGTNFSRDHLSQLQSEHNALWEPSESTDSAPPTPRLASDPPSVEALELHR